MSPPVHLEVTSGILRVFGPGAGFGAPFKYALGIVGDEDVATLKALAATGPSPDDFAAIAACLRAVGFTRMRWARHRPDLRRRALHNRAAPQGRRQPRSTPARGPRRRMAGRDGDGQALCRRRAAAPLRAGAPGRPGLARRRVLVVKRMGAVMRCERCHGRGQISARTTSLRVRSGKCATVRGQLPCPDCGGSGIAHCCEGDQAQPAATEKTIEAPRCECPDDVVGPPIIPELYDSVTELPFVVHRVGECQCTHRLRRYRRGDKTLWLCSCCHLLGDEPVAEGAP